MLHPFVADTYNPLPKPKYSLVMGSPTSGDDFLFTKLTDNVVITMIEGVNQGTGSLIGTVQICNEEGESCSNVEPNMTFDAGLNQFSSMDSPNADKDQTLKWNTSTSTVSGYILIVVHYRVR